MAMTSLCSTAQLERYFSAYGIVTYADHDANDVADTDVLEDCKTYATGYIVGALSQRYTYAQLVTSVIMVELSAVITLRELTLRRGNAPPASLEVKYQEIVAESGTLDRIASGKMPLVDTNGERIAQRNGYAPSHANLTVDRRFAEKRVRVVDGSSNMAGSRLRRDVDRRHFYE